MRSVVACLLLAACGRIDFDPVPIPGECTAQRTVHVSATVGNLAWFTLVWPLPAVIRGFQPNYAYDDPSRALTSSADPQHPLFARELGGRPLWDGNVTAFVAGSNETHIGDPSTTVTARSGRTVPAAGAAAQIGLAPVLPALAFAGSGRYGSSPGAPPLVTVDTVDDAIAALRAVVPISAEHEHELRPDPVEVASWYGPGAPQPVVDLAVQLAFTVTAFRLGLISTVMLPYGVDDPHAAFVDVSTASAEADGITRVLAAFYAELASASEPACRHDGKPLSLADNVMIIVTGDTPKDSFSRVGWPDGTQGGANLFYVRSNGFLIPGWFGEIGPTAAVYFDPLTGLTSPAAVRADATEAAVAGTLHAIARGDRSVVDPFTAASYDGVLAAP